MPSNLQKNLAFLYCCVCVCVCACVSADLDPSRFWIPYDVTHCLGMRSSLKCRKVTYKMCVAHPRKWIRFLLASTVLADLDGQNLRFCEREASLCVQLQYAMCCRSASWSLSSCCDIFNWCLSKQTLFIKSIINCLISQTQLVRSGVECGGVRDVAEQQHCLQNY